MLHHRQVIARVKKQKSSKHQSFSVYGRGSGVFHTFKGKIRIHTFKGNFWMWRDRAARHATVASQLGCAGWCCHMHRSGSRSNATGARGMHLLCSIFKFTERDKQWWGYRHDAAFAYGWCTLSPKFSEAADCNKARMFVVKRLPKCPALEKNCAPRP